MGHVIGIDTTYTGNPVSFSTVSGGTMKSIVAPLTYSQDLHGYANPWPAGGGKNLFPLTEWFQAGYTSTYHGVTMTINADGSITLSGTASPQANFYFSRTTGGFEQNPLYLPEGTYTITMTGTQTRGVKLVVSGSGQNGFPYSEPTPVGTGKTGTITDATQAFSYFLLRITDGTVSDGTYYIQLESGSSATSWQPYSNICPISGLTGLSVYVSPTQDPDDATVYNVDWTTQAGIVFHGTVDPVAGILNVDKVGVDLGSLSWTKYGSTANYDRYISSGIDSLAKSSSSVVCSIFKPRIGSETIVANMTWIASGNSKLSATTDVGAYANASGFKSGMSGQILVYELATPQTYQLTPKTINALVGQNYIWSSNNETLTAVLTAPATGFAGWLIKCVTNGTPVEIPLKYMRAETYTVTPDQRMEWSAERDVTGVLHRETVANLPPKIEFSTPLMTNSDINTLNGIIRAAFTNYRQRNITIQFYDPERNQYWEWDCYMPDVKYNIRNADTANNIINYEELRYAFIGY